MSDVLHRATQKPGKSLALIISVIHILMLWAENREMAVDTAGVSLHKYVSSQSSIGTILCYSLALIANIDWLIRWWKAKVIRDLPWKIDKAFYDFLQALIPLKVFISYRRSFFQVLF